MTLLENMVKSSTRAKMYLCVRKKVLDTLWNQGQCWPPAWSCDLESCVICLTNNLRSKLWMVAMHTCIVHTKPRGQTRHFVFCWFYELNVKWYVGCLRLRSVFLGGEMWRHHEYNVYCFANNSTEEFKVRNIQGSWEDSVVIHWLWMLVAVNYI